MRIILQRIPKQIQLLIPNRRTCHFFPVACRIRYRWDRRTKVVSANRVAGFGDPDLCAWFGLSNNSADVVDGFPEYRFGCRDFGVLEVRVTVGADEVGCFDYLFFMFESRGMRRKWENLQQHFRGGPMWSMYPRAQPIWLLLQQKQASL